MGGKNSGKSVDILGYDRLFDVLKEGGASIKELQEITGLQIRSLYRYMIRIEDEKKVHIARRVRDNTYFLVKP